MKDKGDARVTVTTMPEWMLGGWTGGGGMDVPSLIAEAVATSNPEKLHQAADAMARDKCGKEPSHAE